MADEWAALAEPVEAATTDWDAIGDEIKFDTDIPEKKASLQTFYYPETPENTRKAGLSYSMEGGVQGGAGFSDVDLRNHTLEKYQSGESPFVAVAMAGKPTGELFKTVVNGQTVIAKQVDTGGGLRVGQIDVATSNPELAKHGVARNGVSTGKPVKLEAMYDVPLTSVQTLQTRRAQPVHPEDQPWDTVAEPVEVKPPEAPTMAQQTVDTSPPPDPSWIDKTWNALTTYAGEMIPKTTQEWLQAANIPTSLDPEQIATAVVPMLKPMFGTAHIAERRAKQIYDIESRGEPAYSQNRFNVGIGTFLDIAQLAALRLGAERMPGKYGATGEPLATALPKSVDELITRRVQKPWDTTGITDQGDFIDVPFVRMEDGTLGDRVSSMFTPAEGQRPARGILLKPGEPVPPPLIGYPEIQHSDGTRTIYRPQTPAVSESVPIEVYDESEAFSPAEFEEVPTHEDLALPTMSAKEFDSYLGDLEKQSQLEQAAEETSAFSERGFGGTSTPVAQAIMGMGGIASAGKKSGDIWRGGKLATPRHQAMINNPDGIMPDVAAQNLYDAGLIPDPHVETMRQALLAESQQAHSLFKKGKREQPILPEFETQLPSSDEVKANLEELGLSDEERLIVNGKHYIVANTVTGEIRQLFPTRESGLDYLRNEGEPGAALVERAPRRPDKLIAKRPDDVFTSEQKAITKAAKKLGRTPKTGKDWDEYLKGPELFAPEEQAFNLMGEPLTQEASAEGLARRAAESKYAQEKAQTQLFSQKPSSDFERWFQGSKVVDDAGRPLIVYHGGPKFEGPFKSPAFFTESAFGASWYAGEKGQGNVRVQPHYLSIKNPLDVRTYEGNKTLVEIARKAGVKIKSDIAQWTPDKEIGWQFHSPDIAKHSPYYGDNPADLVYIPKVRQALKKAGYDGIQVSDMLERSEIPTWIALEPSQIRPYKTPLKKFKGKGESGAFGLGHVQPLAKAIVRGQQMRAFKDFNLAKEGAVRQLSSVYARQRGNVIRRDFGTVKEALRKGTKAYRDLEALTAIDEAGRNKARLAEHRKLVASSKKIGMAKKWTPVWDYALREFDRISAMPDKLRDEMNRQIAWEAYRGVDMGYTPNYVPHLFAEEPKGIFGGFFKIGTGGNALPRWFTKTRQYNSLAEAIHEGENPRSVNAADLAEGRIRAGKRLVLGKDYVSALERYPMPDGRPALSAKDVRGYVPIEVYGTKIWAHPEAASYIDVLFDTSAFRKGMGGRGTLKTAAVIKQGKLALDTFHAVRLSMYLAGAGKGITRLPRSGYRRGLATLELSPEQYNRAIASGEYSPAEVAYARKNRPLMIELLGQGAEVSQWADNLAQQMHSLIPGTKRVNSFIFDSLGRGALMTALLENFKRNLARFPELSRQKAARKTVIEMNEMFGNPGRKIFKSKTFQDMMQTLMLAPNWVLTQALNEGRAYAQMAGYPYNVVEGLVRGQGIKSFTRLGATAQSRLALAAGLLVLAEVLNIAFNGETMDNNPEGHKFHAKIPKGTMGLDKDYYFDPAQIPFEFTHQIMKYLRKGEGPLGTAAHIVDNKLSSLFRAGRGAAQYAATGRVQTYRGGPTAKTGPEAARLLAAELLPVPIFAGGVVEPEPRSNLLFRATRRPDALATQAAASGGVKLEPEETARQQMYVKAQAFRRPEDAGIPIQGNYSQLKHALENRDRGAVQTEIELLMKEAPTRADKAKMFDNIHKSLGIGKDNRVLPTYFTHSKEAEQKMQRALKPEERTLYQQAQREHGAMVRYYLMMEPMLKRQTIFGR